MDKESVIRRCQAAYGPLDEVQLQSIDTLERIGVCEDTAVMEMGKRLISVGSCYNGLRGAVTVRGLAVADGGVVVVCVHLVTGVWYALLPSDFLVKVNVDGQARPLYQKN